ncbi:MAG: hypothetical protein ACE361_10785 [Aureliella sp.]
MSVISNLRTLACVLFLSTATLPKSAEAGPLIDWLFGRSNPASAYPVGQPVPIGNGYSAGYGAYPQPNALQPAPGYATNYGNYYGARLPVIGQAGVGYPPPQTNGVAAAVMPPVASYVPNYRTNSYRAPVTYYRPVLTTDPNTGAQVVTMAPCTSYEQLAGRVPVSGRTALFGSTVAPPAAPAAQTLPTYTLPSGGIPLAGVPANSPYSAAYNGYSSYQTVAPSARYPTSNVHSSYYGQSFNGASGGSTGNYVPPVTSGVPGLVAPQSPVIREPAPTYGQPTTPPGQANPFPRTETPAGNVMPDASGDIPPSLPATGDFGGGSASRAPSGRVQGVVQTPARSNVRPSYPSVTVPSLRSDSQQVSAAKPDSEVDFGESTQPEMSPIPVPEGFDTKSRWTPGLLREDDLTAGVRPANALQHYAGQSKKIHWASFDQPVSTNQDSQGSSGKSSRLRPFAPLPSELQSPSTAPRLDSRRTKQTVPHTGWKSSR